MMHPTAELQINYSSKELTCKKSSENLRRYLPFGELFVEQRSTANYYTPYKFSGKEKDEETSYSYFGARYYMSDVSVWLSVDEMAEKYPNTSPYMYCMGNPINLMDLDGMSSSPVFDKNGNFLGTDSEKMSGEIIIANNPNEFHQGMDHNDAKNIGSNYTKERKDISKNARNKILSTVLTGTVLPDNTVIKSSDFRITLNDDPDGNGEYMRYDYKEKKHIINLDLKVEWTVENIREVGGVHELYGHGIMKWGDRFLGGGNHHKIYEAEMNSRYWGEATYNLKVGVVNNYINYFYNEVSIPRGELNECKYPHKYKNIITRYYKH